MPTSMPEAIVAGGVSMYPLLIIAIVLVVLSVNAIRRVLTGIEPDAIVETGIDAILFWGAFAVVIGVLGTLIGIIQAAEAIQRFGDLEATIVWGEISVALIPTVFALLECSVAALVWFMLRTVSRRRDARAEWAAAQA